jgi:RNA polymerase sigma factor (sigma-70 family)
MGLAGGLPDRRRRAQDPYESFRSAPDVIVPGPAEQAEVNAALRTLSPKQRASIVLHYFAGYTYKEIAPIIGSTPSAVSVHVTRGRRRLLVALETHDE